MHMTCPVDKVTAKPKNPESENEQEVPLWPLIVLQGHIFADFFVLKRFTGTNYYRLFTLFNFLAWT